MKLKPIIFFSSLSAIVCASTSVPIVVSDNIEFKQLTKNFFNETTFRSYVSNLTNSFIVKQLFNEENAKSMISQHSDISIDLIEQVNITQGAISPAGYYSLNFYIKLIDGNNFLNNNSNSISLINVVSGVNSTREPNYNSYFKIENNVLVGLTDAGKEQTSLTIPEGVVSLKDSSIINENVFSSAKNLKTIYFPSTLTSIPKWSLSGTSIESVYIPANVKSIGYGAFENCTNLKTVFFDEKSVVTQIPGASFRNSGLELIYLPKSIVTLSDQSFVNTKNLQIVYLLGNSVNLGSTNVIFQNSSPRAHEVFFIINDQTTTKTNLLNQFLDKNSNKIKDTNIIVQSSNGESNVEV